MAVLFICKILVSQSFKTVPSMICIYIRGNIQAVHPKCHPLGGWGEPMNYFCDRNLWPEPGIWTSRMMLSCWPWQKFHVKPQIKLNYYSTHLGWMNVWLSAAGQKCRAGGEFWPTGCRLVCLPTGWCHEYICQFIISLLSYHINLFLIHYPTGHYLQIHWISIFIGSEKFGSQILKFI